MLFVKEFIYFFILHLVLGSSEINLHLTDLANENFQGTSLQHSCLYIAHMSEIPSSFEISSFCTSGSRLEWNNVINTIDPMFTFAELRQRNITSEQLYSWSAPMDVIERYQFYLYEYWNPYVSSEFERYIFYNCTYPFFGPSCQYLLNIDKNPYLSLKELINNYYNQLYQLESLTCYINLVCNRGPLQVCLDWSEICDGKVDCDDGIDEKSCLPLKTNQCKSNEYRCDNGQCIPDTFVNDHFNTFDCLDRSDEYKNLLLPSKYYSNKATFENEDMICSWRGQHMKNYLENIWTSSCINERHEIIEKDIFSDKSPSMTDDCFVSFKCYLNTPATDSWLCSNLCENETCIQIIENTCPDMFIYPNVPIAFGHIYLAYTKQYVINSRTMIQIPPEYICYNEQLCGGFQSNKTLKFNGKTCRLVEDFPIHFIVNGRSSYLDLIKSIYVQLSHCNGIVNDNSTICNSSLMYQCKNSLKCIPYSSIDDGIYDCDYRDDEQITINKPCLKDQSNIFFQCQTENKCIHRNKVEDGICDCQENEYNLCDDEYIQLNKNMRKITFSTVCDGFSDLLPIIINQQNHTDETDCQYWPCNNTYTRCDDLWNCHDGSDEAGCHSLSSIQCSSNYHLCVSPVTNRLMCLPLKNANDGIIDCLGATDESNLCPLTNRYDKKKFYCRSTCLSTENLCDGIVDCANGDDEEFCHNTTIVTVFEKIFHIKLNNNFQSKKAKENLLKSSASVITPFRQHCYRGIPIQIRLNTTTNLTTTGCLCPSSYYGDSCQFQNERVSFILQLNTTSYQNNIPFIIIISLIDHTTERIIHSYQQITYLHEKDQNIKYNIHLLYSTRPKDLSKQYSIHIDIYERVSLFYRGSFFLPLEFPFLPVERIAAKLSIPNQNVIVRSCNNNQCIHGRCIQYLNGPKDTTFCQCESGWTGQYCNIQYSCKCSADSLCIGVGANNRSICVCPINKFGSQCLLTNNICQYDLSQNCLNGGTCIPSDEYTKSRYPFACICPKGFTGDRCEIPDTRMIISFDKNIVLPMRTLMFFHLIYLINNTVTSQNTYPEIICGDETSIISYIPYPFNISFIQLPSNEYYLAFVQKVIHQSITITRTIRSEDRCLPIDQLFPANITNAPLIQRIKYYHLPCQNRSLNLNCFYDEIYMCLCQDNGGLRSANCFEFNHYWTIDNLDHYFLQINYQCSSNYSSNSPNPSVSSTTSILSTSSITATQTAMNGITSMYTCEYFLSLFMLVFYFI